MNSENLSPVLRAQLPVLQSVTCLFHPYVEAVLHDLSKGEIAAIYNNLSKRKVGDQSAITKFTGTHLNEFPDFFKPYYKTNWDGRRFKCISATIRDEQGVPVGLICFNFDTNVFRDITIQMENLLGTNEQDTLSPIEQFTEDWQQRVNECIGNYLKENNATLKTLTKEQKREVVNRLYNHGLFNYRKSAAYISGQLGVSRATIYNYLKEG